MDERIRARLMGGRLTDGDVRRIIDWQLTLRAEAIDQGLVNECLLYLYPDEPGLCGERRTQLFSRLAQAVSGPRRAIGRRGTHRRRYPARTVLIAALLLALLAGVAVAATLGIFARFIDDPMIEMSRQRLQHLTEVAQTVGETIQVNAPTAELSQISLKTDYDQILARQYGRRFELTVDQVYCDGNKLYYSYMLREPERGMALYEGKPSGFETWDWSHPGESIADSRWFVGMTEEENEQAQAWFAQGGPRYAVVDRFGLGDGADLNDGTERGISLNIFDSGDEMLDAYTRQGFQQVDLPEDYVPDDTIDFYLTVMYSATVIYQDETGFYEAIVRMPENRGFTRVPFTAGITGSPEEFVQTAVFDEYAAEAHLAISDVDISGRVYIDAPQAWIDEVSSWEDGHEDIEPYVMDYTLVADGVTCPNVDGGYGVDRKTGRWVVYIRYDLPDSMDSLVLVPRRHLDGPAEEECIVIR